MYNECYLCDERGGNWSVCMLSGSQVQLHIQAQVSCSSVWRVAGRLSGGGVWDHKTGRSLVRSGLAHLQRCGHVQRCRNQREMEGQAVPVSTHTPAVSALSCVSVLWCLYIVVTGIVLSLSVNLLLSHLFAFFLSYSCSRSLFFLSFSSFFLFAFLVEVEYSSTVVSDYMVIYILEGYSIWGIFLHCFSALFYCLSNEVVYLHITLYLLSIEVCIVRDQFLVCEMSRDAKCRNKMIAPAAEI